MKEQLESYKALLRFVKKHKDIIGDDSSLPSISTVEERIERCKVSVEFGIDLSTNKSSGWGDHYSIYNPVHTDIYLTKYDGVERKISWPDNDKQPKNEWLYGIVFPTGAYFFGDHYPTELFKQFFNELCTYNPKYRGTTNKALYFTSENAKIIHEAYPAIVKKYRDMVEEDAKRIKIEKMKAELAKLEG
jgi:hypothetical protein